MNQIMVVYWSQTGNTEAMANAVAEGIRKAGKDALVTEVSNISADALKDAGVFALGCPAMGAEVLEESEMDPFVAEVETFASGKHIGLFGSYGWGGGPNGQCRSRRSGRRRRHCPGESGRRCTQSVQGAGRGSGGRRSIMQNHNCRYHVFWQTFRFAFFWRYGIMMEWCHDFIKAAGGYKTYGKLRRQRQD